MLSSQSDPLVSLGFLHSIVQLSSTVESRPIYISMYVCVGSRFAGWLRGELKSLPISFHYTETSPQITQLSYYEKGNKDHFSIYSVLFLQ